MGIDLERPDGDRTPTLDEVLEIAIKSALVKINISMPGKFVSYDHETQRASIQPLINRTLVGGIKINLPIIANVPVFHPRSGASFIHVPIKAGDPCYIVFAQRSLDTWKQSDGVSVVDPDDERKFDLTDAVAYPGVSSELSTFTPENGDDVIIQNEDSKVNIKPDGKIFIDSPLVEIGAGTLEKVLNGEAFQTFFNAHIHTGNLGAPTTPPTTLSGPAQLSTKVKAAT